MGEGLEVDDSEVVCDCYASGWKILVDGLCGAGERLAGVIIYDDSATLLHMREYQAERIADAFVEVAV